jgi:hypothetical protein
MKAQDMKYIFYLFLYYPQKFFNSQIMCLNLIFFQKMIIEILFNNKNQIFSFETIHIYIYKYNLCTLLKELYE